MHILSIIDRSGSMIGLRDDTIGGYAAFLEQQKAVAQPGDKLTLILFDSNASVHPTVELSEAEPLTADTYVPMGGTALFDAIGLGLAQLSLANPERAIVLIQTDGGENASKEYTRAAVKGAVERANERGWEVIFMAANQDAFETGSQLGVLRGNAMNYDASQAGTEQLFTTMSARATNYRAATTEEQTP